MALNRAVVPALAAPRIRKSGNFLDLSGTWIFNSLLKRIFAQSLWSFWNNSGHIFGAVEGKKAPRITIDFHFESGARTFQEIHETRSPQRQVAHFDSCPTR
jgi:hypothetical protein